MDAVVDVDDAAVVFFALFVGEADVEVAFAFD